MSASIFLDAQFVRGEVERLIARFPELADDDTLRMDAIEGETDAHRIISRALRERQEAEMMAEAIAARVTEMAGRRARFERKSEAMKELIRGMMKAAKLPKLVLPEATVSILPGRTSVGIGDLNDLPQGYFKTYREADKAAIKQAFDRGEEIPGAHLVTGSEGLSIRSK